MNYTLTNKNTNELEVKAAQQITAASQPGPLRCVQEASRSLIGHLRVGVATFRSNQWPRAGTLSCYSHFLDPACQGVHGSCRISPLAVITVVGLLDVLRVSNSAELKSFSLTICILAPESTTNYLSYGSFVDAAGSTHSTAGKWNVALSFSLSLQMILARFQALLRAHRCCLSVSSWDRLSNFMASGLR